MQYSYKKKLKWDINNKKEQDINNIKRHCEERDNQKETIINNTPFPLEIHKYCQNIVVFVFCFFVVINYILLLTNVLKMNFLKEEEE